MMLPVMQNGLVVRSFSTANRVVSEGIVQKSVVDKRHKLITACSSIIILQNKRRLSSSLEKSEQVTYKNYCWYNQILKTLFFSVGVSNIFK